MTKYTTIANVKETLSDITYENLGYENESEFDRFISRLIDRASRLIDNYCQRPSNFFNGGSSVTQIESGKSYASAGTYPETERSYEAEIKRRTYRLNQTPIINDTDVSYNTAQIGASDNWQATTAYRLDKETGELVFAWSVNISHGIKNVRFVYTAGFVVTPNEVAWACEEIVVNAIKKMMQDGVNARIKFARPMHISLRSVDVFTDGVKEMLEAYRKVNL